MSDSDETTSTPTPTSTTTAPEPERPLRILVTNDDGVGAEGIAALVDALSALDNTEVTVVAPAENQSGSGSKTTDNDAFVGVEAETASGVPAT